MQRVLSYVTIFGQIPAVDCFRENNCRSNDSDIVVDNETELIEARDLQRNAFVRSQLRHCGLNEVRLALISLETFGSFVFLECK